MTHEWAVGRACQRRLLCHGPGSGKRRASALAGNSALAEIPVEALQGLLEKNGAYLGRDVN